MKQQGKTMVESCCARVKRSAPQMAPMNVHLFQITSKKYHAPPIATVEEIGSLAHPKWPVEKWSHASWEADTSHNPKPTADEKNAKKTKW